MKVAIVGTAGRKGSIDYLSKEIYLKAKQLSLESILEVGKRMNIPLHEMTLLCGGAAWMDHLNITLWKTQGVRFEELQLHLPAPLDMDQSRFVEDPHKGRLCPGRISNYYHYGFAEKLGAAQNATLKSICDLSTQVPTSYYDGFHARNLALGRCDLLIALTLPSNPSIPLLREFTYGSPLWNDPRGAGISSGGTLHCYQNSLAPIKMVVNLHRL